MFWSPCQTFILRQIKRSCTTPFKKNKHKKKDRKAHVAKACAATQKLSKSSGGAPGINTCAQLLSRASFQYIHNSGNDPTCPNPKLVAKRGANTFLVDAAGKMQTRAHRLGGNVWLEAPQTGSHEQNDPQRGWSVQQEGMRAGGIAQQRDCVCGQVFDDPATRTLADGFT